MPFDRIKKAGFIPVIEIEDAAKAEALAEALLSGGMETCEITFRSPAAYEALKRIRRAFPELLLGAGTVLDKERAKQAIEAGADFAVAPGFDAELADFFRAKSLPFIPGVLSPSEIGAALSRGIGTLKFFPAEQAGGLPFIKAVSAPFGSARFIPTGGISLSNLENYLRFQKVIACGGSFVASKDMIRSGNWGEIRDICRRTAETVRNARSCNG